MTFLIAGLILFFALHMIPHQPKLKLELIRQLGTRIYLATFTLLSLAGLALIIYGKATAAFVPLWEPPWYGVLRHLTYAFNLIFCILLMAVFIPCNIRRRLHHPMLIGFACWGWGHLLVNGDLASLLLFGSFAIYATYSVYSAIQRLKICELPPQPNWRDAVVVAIGAVMYSVMVQLHGALYGVALVAAG
ncbi:NnrU family protein [Corallincola platygyrae]|uniref:NnrU family protein n=1 Tax=Corallincola platygyrae TaxID=1193278 RepID=A0ABW4XN80_9GAMM